MTKEELIEIVNAIKETVITEIEEAKFVDDVQAVEDGKALVRYLNASEDSFYLCILDKLQK